MILNTLGGLYVVRRWFVKKKKKYMEKDIEQYLRLETKKRGGLALKFVSPGFNGVPDRLILFPGAIIVFAETKDTGKKLRVRQEYVKQQFEALGFRVEKIDSKQQVKNFLDEIYPA